MPWRTVKVDLGGSLRAVAGAGSRVVGGIELGGYSRVSEQLQDRSHDGVMVLDEHGGVTRRFGCRLRVVMAVPPAS